MALRFRYSWSVPRLRDGLCCAFGSLLQPLRPLGREPRAGGAWACAWARWLGGAQQARSSAAAAAPADPPRGPARSWEDGERTDHDTDTFERWSVHTAGELDLTVCGIELRVIQKVGAPPGRALQLQGAAC
jgi:hypothetical protein